MVFFKFTVTQATIISDESVSGTQARDSDSESVPRRPPAAGVTGRPAGMRRAGSSLTNRCRPTVIDGDGVAVSAGPTRARVGLRVGLLCRGPAA